MSSPLMHCEEHGIFPEPGFINFTNSTNVTFADNTVTCPKCGVAGKIIDGTYSDSNGVVTASLKLTSKQFHALKQTLAWAEQELSKPEPDLPKVEQVLEKTIEKQAPTLWQRLKYALPILAGEAVVQILIEAATLLVNYQANQAITEDDLERIVDAAVRAAVETQNLLTPEPSVPESP